MTIPKDFVGYAGDPELESEVVFLFGMLYDHVVKAMGIPFATTKVRGAFPDCLGINQNTGKPVRIEFEVRSSNFLSHGHPADGCEYIVCWVDDWSASPIPVISLKSIIDKTHTLGTRFLYVPRPGSPLEKLQENKLLAPDVYDAITYFLNELFPAVRERCPQLDLIFGKEKRFCFRYDGNAEPPLEISPDGEISGREIGRMTNIFTKSVAETAQQLKSEIGRIRYLKTREDAQRLAERLQAFGLSIPEDYAQRKRRSQA